MGKLYSSQQVAAHYGVTQRRINTLALERGVGTLVGNRRVFSQQDIRALKPGKPGNPNLGKKPRRPA